MRRSDDARMVLGSLQTPKMDHEEGLMWLFLYFDYDTHNQAF